MQKPKVNIDRPKISSKEIAAKRNFKSVLDNYQTLYKPFYKKNWFLANSFIVTLVVGTLLIMDFEEQSKQAAPIKKVVVESSPFGHPQVKGMVMEFESFEVDPAKGGELVAASGTKMKIPANAFVDAIGKPVVGAVDIKFRQFDDPRSMFASGMPMNYDSAGQVYPFESAGMIEVRGFQNGQPIYIAEEKSIDIEMVSGYDENDYNLYSYSDEEQRWEYEGQDKVEGGNSFTYLPAASKSADSIDAGPLYTIAKQEADIKHAMGVFKQENCPVEPRKPKKDAYQFDLDVLNNEFPELSVYKNIQFEVPKDEKNFDPKYYKAAWEDVKLEKTRTKGVYSLALSRKKYKVNFNVYPVYEGEEFEQATAQFEKDFVKYKTALNTRKVEDAKRLAELEKRRKELEDEREKLLADQEATYQQMLQRASTKNKVNRVFSINKFRAYNCDRPSLYPKGHQVLAQFADDQGNQLLFNQVTLVEKGRNAIFRINNTQFNQMKFNPKKHNVLWAITREGNLAVAGFEEFKKVPRQGGAYTFTMKITSSDSLNFGEMEQYLEI